MCDKRRFLILAMLAACVAVGETAKDDGRGRHSEFYLVPAPQPVVVDGELDEWDLSGQIEMFVTEETRETMKARIAAMYDDDALFISGEITDPTPLMNQHDPRLNPDKAWNADSFQFRMVTDPAAGYPSNENAFVYRTPDPPRDVRDDIVHLLLWHHSQDGRPYLQMAQGMSYRVTRQNRQPGGLVPPDEYQGAYRKWSDGRGYTFEYRIPWSTLDCRQPPRAGDVVAGTMQINWSRPDGLATGGHSAWSYDVLGSPGFPYQNSACWGHLIFAEKGNLSPEQVDAGLPPERQPPLVFSYDLPKDSGHTVIQLFNEDNQAVRVLVAEGYRPAGRNMERWDGLDDQGRLLPTGTYHWRGVRANQPLTIDYQFSVHNSGQPPYPTDDNTGGWGADHGLPQDIVRINDGVVIAWDKAEYGWGIIRTDLTGRKKWGTKYGAQFLATDGRLLFYAGDRGFYPDPAVRILDLADSRPSYIGDYVDKIPAPPGTTNEADNAVSGLACSHGLLYVSYAERDLIGVFSIKNGNLLKTLHLPTPQRIAVSGEDSVLVVSDGKIVEARVSSDTWQVKIANHLDNPRGLAVGSDGRIFVANRGSLQNVTVFNPDGPPVQTIGLAGGRPAVGAYDRSGMYQAEGIALDDQGRLWVAEEADYPKRVSVWDTSTGANLAEYFGGSDYFAYGNIDPRRPDEIYAHNVLWSVDWSNKTTRPLTTIWRRTEPDHAPPPRESGYGGNFRLFTADDGRQFGWGGTDRHHNTLLYMRNGDRLRPIAGFVNPWNTPLPGLEDMKRRMSEEWEAKRTPSHLRPQILFWQDADDNGRVQPGETTRMTETRLAFNWVDPDLTLRFSNGTLLHPHAFDPTGKPLYDFDQCETGGVAGPRDYVVRAPDGASIRLQHRKGPSLVRLAADGAMEWNYPDLVSWPHALDLPIVKPGRLWGMTGNMGIAGDYFAIMTYFGPNHIFRLDGSYIGTVIKDSRLGGLGPYTGQPEGQGGSFVKLRIKGKTRYFLIEGGQDVRVLEVPGLDELEDIPGGTHIHTEADVALARAAQADSTDTGTIQMRIAPGGIAALEEAPETIRTLEDGRGFRTRMSHDDRNLHIRFDVQSPCGLVNNQPNPQILFKGGNVLDIQLAANPTADPKRTSPVPGDQRLLVTRQEGKPLAVLFKPRVEGFTGTPIVLKSPTGSESFDRIVKVAVALDYVETEDGFRATLTVPQSLLGIRLKTGQSLSMDLGYVFGNHEGTQAAVRAYHVNNSFTANVKDDIPHESRLEPSQWGVAHVE